LKKILISTSKKINFLKKIFFNEVYLYPNNNIKDNQNNKGNIRYISPDFIDLRETFLSENNAAKFSKEILPKYIGDVPNLFSNKDNYNFLYWDIRKYLSIESSKYFKYEYLADKILKKDDIKGSRIFLDIDDIDYKVLSLLISSKKIKYSIPFFSTAKSILRSSLRSIFSFFYLLIFPEIKFFFCKNFYKKKTSFKIGYNLFSRQVFDDWHGSPDFFLKNKKFDKDEVVYVSSSSLQISKTALADYTLWNNELNEKKYNLVDLNSISKFISKKNYLKLIYPEAKRIRKFFFKNFKIFNILNINALNILIFYINWKIFYQLYNVKHFFSSMIFGENITNYIQSENSRSTNFIYFSTTGELLDERKFKNNTEWIQYSFKRYDNFFGTKLSYEQFKSYENIFKNYNETGNLSSAKILSSNKNEIFHKLKISNNLKLISFFDDTWAFGGTQSFSGYDKYLESIIKISNENQNYAYIFKPKKNFDYFLKTSNEKILNKFQTIVKSKRIIFFDNSLGSKYKIDAHNLISASEICVFSPMSSLSYDALCSKKKCIVFDPDHLYYDKKYILTLSELLYAQNYQELSNLLKYWGNNEHDYMLDILNDRYIKPFIDKYCDKYSVDRFINYLS
jgi:hypothetical protein